MISKENLYDSVLPWHSSAYDVAARYRRLASVSGETGMRLRYVEVEPGGRILPHVQEETELLFCIAGQGRYTQQDESTPLLPGDCLVAIRGSIQGITNEGGETLRLLALGADRGEWDITALLRQIRRALP